MKSLKTIPILLALFVFSLLTMKYAIAQPENYSIITVPHTDIAYCGTEIVVGTQTTETRWNANKVQIKVHWSLIGQESGDQIEAGFVSNEITIDNGPNGASVENFRLTFVGKRNGKPMGHGYINGHVTLNADGVPVVDFSNVEWICHKKF